MASISKGIPSQTNFIGGSYDDAQWVILALWKIADYKSARGLSASAYLVRYTLELLRHQSLTYDSCRVRTAQQLFTILSQANGTLGRACCSRRKFCALADINHHSCGGGGTRNIAVLRTI